MQLKDFRATYREQAKYMPATVKVQLINTYVNRIKEVTIDEDDDEGRLESLWNKVNKAIKENEKIYITMSKGLIKELVKEGKKEIKDYLIELREFGTYTNELKDAGKRL